MEHRVDRFELWNALASLDAEFLELETPAEDRLGRLVENIEV